MAIEDYYRDLTAQTPKRTVDEYGDAVNTLGTPRTFRGYIGKPTSAQQSRACRARISVASTFRAGGTQSLAQRSVVTT